ncbi:hypothetical protein OsccyDRAFT_4215 [Leptolyngbyaceae cyanobacterium JSC-12]|nr:hypothetical protein OsccyDRAFT_4215 [Leptolyngbyaceae cyanobacterium JSC-12]
MVSQVWGKVGKILGGLFLVGGGTISFGILFGIAVGHPGGILLTVLLVLLVFFGLVPASLGGLMLYTSLKAEHYAIRDRFFQLLQANQGRLSLLDFAAATRLEPAIARRYLDLWAREFSANFEVTEDGDIDYIFTNRAIALPESRWQAIGQTMRELIKSL